ncbi:multiple PDZ domain isoform X3 [Brachionus plicatilis]|uniref:Multiple PDZ domain isoform X3 n=1 Tax=Brachionus plicatilis TaxID=10195 RepID=A0A3M7S150_BRAPC|nr:multiple PDZ domain isoform X3 [Brachionus plicatilis]
MKKSDDKIDTQVQNKNSDQLNQDLSHGANFGRKLNKDCQNKQNIERLRISVLDGQTFDQVEQVNSMDESDLSKSLWGPQRIVILEREENQSLGISIVGGKLDVSTQKGCDVQLNFISGIFIKHVQAKSPAGINGLLKTGDRILGVNDVDVTQASHDQAVVVIKNAKSPVKFLIQSLICVDSQVELSDLSCSKISKEHHDDKNDLSSDNLKQIVAQPNKYNYSLESIKEKYSYFLEPKENESESSLNCEEKNELFIFRLEKSFANQSLGLCLSGNVNLDKTSVFVCAIYPNSIAQNHGLIKIGDQILEINGQLIYGRAHSNVTPFIKNIKDLQVYMVIYRNAQNLNQMFRPANNYLADFKYQQRLGEEEAAIETAAESKHHHCVALDSLSNSASQRSSISADYSESLLSSSSQNNHLTEQNSTTTSSCLHTQKIMLKKKSNGFGIAISEHKNERLVVRGLNSNGIAFQASDGRLQVGDEIVAVNNIKVNTMKYDDIMNLLQTTDEPVEFEVTKKEVLHKMQTEMQTEIQTVQDHMKHVRQTSQIVRQRCNSQSHEEKAKTSQSVDSTTSQSNKSKTIQSSFETNACYLQCCKIENKKINQKQNECSSQITNDDPKTNSIKVGCETWIEIDRKKTGLGLSIIGGCDTQLPGIIINDIYQNGAAFNDNRLLIGDQIIKVNNTDLISATHDQALNALRQTSDCVRLLIHRSFSNNEKNGHTSNSEQFESFNNQDNEKFMHIITVELNKKFGKGLGFSIIGRREGSGVFISHIIDGGCADRDGRLTVGDLILEVNDQDIRKSAYNDVAFLLKTLPQGKVTLKIGRFKTSTNRQNSTRASLNGSKINSTRNSNLDLDNLENSLVSNDISNFKPCKKK